MLAVAFVASLGAAGCGGTGSYCSEAAQCEGGNDLDEEACNTYFGQLEELAGLYNCSSEYDDYFGCLEEESRCNDDRYTPNDGVCEPERERLEDCGNHLGGEL